MVNAQYIFLQKFSETNLLSGCLLIKTDSKDEDSDNEENSEEDEIQAAMRNPFDLLNEDE